jgi:hypothetical protein
MIDVFAKRKKKKRNRASAWIRGDRQPEIFTAQPYDTGCIATSTSHEKLIFWG